MSQNQEILIHHRQGERFPRLMEPSNLPGRIFLMVENGYGIDLTNSNSEYRITGPWNMSAMVDFNGSAKLLNGFV